LHFDYDLALVQEESSFWDWLLANSKDELVIDLTKVFPGQQV
jgi:hypothetical protein